MKTRIRVHLWRACFTIYPSFRERISIPARIQLLSPEVLDAACERVESAVLLKLKDEKRLTPEGAIKMSKRLQRTL